MDLCVAQKPSSRLTILLADGTWEVPFSPFTAYFLFAVPQKFELHPMFYSVIVGGFRSFPQERMGWHSPFWNDVSKYPDLFTWDEWRPPLFHWPENNSPWTNFSCLLVLIHSQAMTCPAQLSSHNERLNTCRTNSFKYPWMCFLLNDSLPEITNYTHFLTEQMFYSNEHFSLHSSKLIVMYVILKCCLELT